MAQPKFTEGPWCLSPNGGYVRRTLHGYNIAALNNALEEHPANARLIAAAPDLYAALEAAEALLKLHGYPAFKNSDSIRAQARAALAKADGNA